MKLLVVSQYFWPENFRINDLVREFVVRGHEVTVLTSLPNYPDGKIFAAYRDAPEKFTDYFGAKVIRVPLIPRGRGGLRLSLNYASFALSACLLGPFKLRNTEFDCILAFEPSPVTVALPGILLRWLRRKPMAFWVQDLWPETLEAIGVVKSPAILKLVGKLVSFIYNRCDLILAQSKSFMPSIAACCNYPERIVYFPNWSDDVRGQSGDAPASEVVVRPGAFNILFAGNIGEAQDFPAILDAAEILRNNTSIRWLIVGDGRMAPWLREQIAERGLQKQIEMLGRFPLERMPSFYRHADACLLSLQAKPIFAMTIPSKLQSYLSAGIPILAMVDGEGARIVQQGGAGLACPAGDSHALAKAVTRLAAMAPDQRRSMGERARASSAAEFDRTTLIGQLETMLDQFKYLG